ncbi:hypothetical protein [Dickeya dadantii]|uniref:hypothetical protein n=1 Tax=Dickeya dadantii TaxID=204038 RepID=UPI001FD21A12|nr:hypothetical protein [Dickeya dadantii]
MTDQLVTVANHLGLRDPEWFYLLVVLINMVITVVLYGLCMRVWKYYQPMKRESEK